MSMRKTKKMLSAFCAAAVVLSPIAGGIIPTGTETVYAGQYVVETETLSAPQNVREEDGFIVWDDMDEAYGYTVRAVKGDEEVSDVYYPNRVECKRFFYEHNMDFGDYVFAVCAFDEASKIGEWSAPVSVTYAPGFVTPLNVRLSEDGKEILWEKVDGAARYNFRILQNDAIYNRSWQSANSTSILLSNYIYESGDFYFEIQAMDEDYNVSAWSEPVSVSFTEYSKLEAPKNVRFDESGNNVLWDEVDGAAYYIIDISTPVGSDNDRIGGSDVTYQPKYDNWKSLACPFSAMGEYYIQVSAYGEEVNPSVYSESLVAEFSLLRDESIALPGKVWMENNSLYWDEVEGANNYWEHFSLNSEEGKLIYDGGYAYGKYCSLYIGGDSLPAGTYEAEIFVVDENGSYNGKKYSIEINTVLDETVWVPELYYKFDSLLWDWDQLRHENTDCFWLRFSKDGGIVKLNKFYGSQDWLGGLENGNYTVEVCVSEHDENWNYKIGSWSEPLSFMKHEGGLFDEENESTSDVEKAPEADGIPEDDRITRITVNPAFNMKNKYDENAEFDLSKIRIKAKEIYDEEGLKKAEEALGNEIVGNKHYNLLDLTLWEGDRDISNGYDGLVQVIIPLPNGHRDKTFSCYRLTEVDGIMTKEIIPGEQTEDSYIIYLEHFSQYALVADGGEEEHIHEFGNEWKYDENSHRHECECGVADEKISHRISGEPTVIQPEGEKPGVKTWVCEDCGYVMKTEEIPAKEPDEEPTVPEDKPSDNGSPDGGYGAGTEFYAALAMIAGMLYLLLYFSKTKLGETGKK